MQKCIIHFCMLVAKLYILNKSKNFILNKSMNYMYVNEINELYFK